jgi:hypothetical protein
MIETFSRGWRGSGATSSCRLPIRVIRGSFVVLLFCSLPAAYAKCPVNENTTLVVKAETGDLQVDTTGREPVVDVQADGAQVRENCTKDKAEYTGSGGAHVLKITTPKDIDLDLDTRGGNINVGDVDGNVALKTSGGSVTTGNIKGNANIITQGGPIKSGNIGGNAALRSPGTIEVGDVGNNAEFHTTAGRVTAGNVAGSLAIEAGRTISIIRAGEVKATTNAGDISIGEAARINAKSGGGHITTRRVRGPFQGHTEQGDIRLDSAGSWVEASTGQGNILVRMVPENFDGDLHMDLQAGVGDVMVYLPPRMHASIDATVQKPAFQAQQIFSEFPTAPSRPPQTLIPNNRYYTPTHSEFWSNGGGNQIVLHTSLGKITIRKN